MFYFLFIYFLIFYLWFFFDFLILIYLFFVYFFSVQTECVRASHILGRYVEQFMKFNLLSIYHFFAKEGPQIRWSFF